MAPRLYNMEKAMLRTSKYATGTISALHKIIGPNSRLDPLAVPNSLIRPYFHNRARQGLPLDEGLRDAISDAKTTPFMATLIVSGKPLNHTVAYSQGGMTLRFIIPKELPEINSGLEGGLALVFDLSTIYSFEHGSFAAPKKSINATLSTSPQFFIASVTPDMDKDGIQNSMKLVKLVPEGTELPCNDGSLYVPSLALNTGNNGRIPVVSNIQHRKSFIGLLTGDEKSISVANLSDYRPLLILK